MTPGCRSDWIPESKERPIEYSESHTVIVLHSHLKHGCAEISTCSVARARGTAINMYHCRQDLRMLTVRWWRSRSVLANNRRVANAYQSKERYILMDEVGSQRHTRSLRNSQYGRCDHQATDLAHRRQANWRTKSYDNHPPWQSINVPASQYRHTRR